MLKGPACENAVGGRSLGNLRFAMLPSFRPNKIVKSNNMPLNLGECFSACPGVRRQHFLCDFRSVWNSILTERLQEKASVSRSFQI